MLKKFTPILILLLVSASFFAQPDPGFHFVNPNQRAIKIKFEQLNNLIIIPVELNGVELSFLLDTGVDKTLLIALEAGESMELNKANQVNIRGLGIDDNFVAYQSIENTLQIGSAIHNNKDVYFILDKDNKLTKRLGLPINGIIGYDFFKDFIVRIDYKRNLIKLYNPEKFNRKLRSFEALPLLFYKRKPYLNLKVKDSSITKPNLNLLFDTGSGSSFWLLEKEYIQVPQLYFKDILGYGFNSTIKGKRSRVQEVVLGKYRINQPTVAYPNVDQIIQIEQNVMRDGTIGAEILRRFKWFIDYPNKRIYFKSNSNYNETFGYDMSGLVLEFDGIKMVKRIKSVKMNIEKYTQFNEELNPKSRNDFILSVEIQPKLIISDIRLESPAADASIKVGDELIKINSKEVYQLKLKQIQQILSEEEGKEVKLELNRKGKILKKEIYLRDRFKDLIQNSKN